MKDPPLDLKPKKLSSQKEILASTAMSTFIDTVENNFIQYESLKDPEFTSLSSTRVGFSQTSRSISSGDASTYRSTGKNRSGLPMLSLNTDVRGSDSFLSPYDKSTTSASNNLCLDRIDYSSKSAGINSKSLPHTRRNSLDLSSIWTTLQALDLDDSPPKTRTNSIVSTRYDLESTSTPKSFSSSSPAFSNSILTSDTLRIDKDIHGFPLFDREEGTNVTSTTPTTTTATTIISTLNNVCSITMMNMVILFRHQVI